MDFVVMPAVHSELVALAGNSANQLWINICHFAEHEPSGSGFVLRTQTQ
jgi:hypothetical protein